MQTGLLKQDTVEVTICEVTFESDDGRFVVARVEPLNEKGSQFVAVGNLGEVSQGETLRLHGRFGKHAKYGERFRVQSFVPVMPDSLDGVRRYLGSGMIPGIGKGLAKRLVAQFGAETLDIIATQSGRLREVDGIGAQRAASIAEAVRARRDEADVMAFFHTIGLGPALGRRILSRYGFDAPRQLRDDPYLVAEQVQGVGFSTADKIGKAVGIADDDPRRASGAALHVLARAADQGHALLPMRELQIRCEALGVSPNNTAEAVGALAQREMLILDSPEPGNTQNPAVRAQSATEFDVYAPPLFAAEVELARRLSTLARERQPSKLRDVAMKKVDAYLGQTPLSKDQRLAVETSIDAGLMVLTGGPGTGKTTTVRAIVAAQKALERRVMLCAPTGRAAKRLTEATGAEAKTIHRLLEWNPVTGTFKRNAEAPLEVDVILVDEASMLNLTLARSLLDAIADSTRLVLVGDVDQLPPVGAGQVLREVIASEASSLVRLSEVFRQAQESAIVRGAHAILRGELPEASQAQAAGQGGELFVVRARATEDIHRQLMRLMDRIAARYGFDGKEEVQVLVPTRRGALGAQGLNEVLQKGLNPNADPKRLGQFFVGDKVMQLKNDYDKDVFNGDLGVVRRVQGGTTYVLIDGREVQYKVDELDKLTLAYASTVHKVQGSEFPAVVVVLHGSHHVLLSRALLYTAVTRAKKLVVVLGDPSALARAARNVSTDESYCRLGQRLNRAFQKP